jgi:hypothetical protein
MSNGSWRPLRCIWPVTGGYNFTKCTASADRFRRLADTWRPGDRPTNGYEVPMVDPLVVGRWFMGGRDGRVRCYYLRRPV